MYDFPDPETAKITELALGKENLSNKTNELLCLLIPYNIPSFELRSNEIKGKTLERGLVLIRVEIERRSKP